MDDANRQLKSRRWLIALWVMLVMLQGCSLPFGGRAATTPTIEALKPVEPPAWLDEYHPNLVERLRGDLERMADAPRYDIDLEIGDDVATISGSLAVEFTNPVGQALTEVYFRMFPNTAGDNLRVDDVRVNDVEAIWELRFQNTALRVNLAEPLQPGESVHISMKFDQQVPSVMGGNYGLYIYQEDILALDAFFPIIPVVSSQGWQVSDPPPNADMIFTEAAFFQVRVSAPARLVLVASGVQTDMVEQADRRTITYIAGPQRDFYLAASPRFTSHSMQVGGTLLTSYFPEEYRATGEKVLLSAVQAFNIYSELYGEYPYTQLNLVSTPMLAAGMEYSGVAALALNLYSLEPAADQPPGTWFLESAVAHEVAHQWFFNQVMNDPLREPWLDEGLAQYLTYIYYRENYGSDAGYLYVDSWRARWERADNANIPIGRPAGEYSPLEYNAIIYGRAPLFILELQRRFGDEEFNAFLRDFVQAHRWRIFSSRDFKNMLEERCDCDLTDMFIEWVGE